MSVSKLLFRPEPASVGPLLSLACACLVLGAAGCSNSEPIFGAGGSGSLDSTVPLFQWQGDAGRISGAAVISRHEAIWNDYLYDDYGANIDGFESTNPDYGVVLTGAHVEPGDPTNPVIAGSLHNSRFRHSGDYGYPATDPAADPHSYLNLADIDEIRLTVFGDRLIARVLLTALVSADSTVIGVAIDTDDDDATGANEWPFSANLRSDGWDAFITIGGAEAWLSLADGRTLPFAELGGELRIDLERNSVEFELPLDAVGTADRAWNLVAGAGLWDAGQQAWLQVQASTTQGGSPAATPTAARLFDLAFNQGEPNTLWDDSAQSNALAAGDASAHAWRVHLGELGSDRARACVPGPRKESVRATLELGEGLRAHTHSGVVNYDYLWREQPMAVMLPTSACDPALPLPAMDLFFHPGNGNHNVWLVGVEAAEARPNYVNGVPLGYEHVTAVAESTNRITVSGLSLGEGWNYGERPGEEHADLDVLDAAAARYRHDPTRVRAIGMSRGGQGAIWFAQHYPDKLSQGVAFSGAWFRPQIVNLRNTPMLNIHGDQFIDATGLPDYNAFSDGLDALDYQHLHLLYEGRGHDFNLVEEAREIVDAWTTVPRLENPARITYRITPADRRPGIPLFPGVDWVASAELADENADGLIDLTSLALAHKLPAQALRFSGSFTNLDTGNSIQMSGLSYHGEDYVRARTPDQLQPGWVGAGLSFEVSALELPTARDALTGTVSGVSALTLDMDRAGLSALPSIELLTDTPLQLTLRSGGAQRTVTIQP